MTDSVMPKGGDLADDATYEGAERRRMRRPALTEAMKAAAFTRAKGICECTNQNCWHFRRCKAPGLTYLGKRSASGALSCSLYCRECARATGPDGSGERL